MGALAVSELRDGQGKIAMKADAGQSMPIPKEEGNVMY